MTNPNNCAACKHKEYPDGGWCYMFPLEPTRVCAHHTRRTEMFIEYMHSWLGVYFEKQALAQQEQPVSVDAYVGAREDAAIWKKRALEAEELNRKFIAELNGPTYLGEPVKQEQPEQEPEAWLIPSLASFKDAKSVSFSRVEGCTLTDAQLIEKMSGEVLWRVEVFSDGDGVIDKHGAHHAPKPLYTHPAPAQPALSDDDIEKVIAKGVKSGSISWTGFREDGEGKYTVPILSEHHCQIARAIEAHCRGGAGK